MTVASQRLLDIPPPEPASAPPATTLAPTIAQMRTALAPFCRKRNAHALMLFAIDLGLFASGQWLALAGSHAALRLLGALITWAAIVRLFVIGHDACHQALTSSSRLNDTIGRIAFLVSLTPYSLWRVGHNVVHHGYNNLRGRDFVWEPMDPAEYKALPRWRRAVERIYRGAAGPALYYFVEIWWKRLFFPSRRQMPTSRRDFMMDSTLAAGFAALWIGAICAYALANSLSAWTAVLTAFVLPFVLWNWTMGLVVYLHHTHPKIRWYAEKKEWQREAAQVSGTIHMVFPRLLGATMHHIMEHPAHHLISTIPLYHLKAAQQRLHDIGAVFTSTRLSLRHYLECIRSCQLYDYERKGWCPFPD